MPLCVDILIMGWGIEKISRTVKIHEIVVLYDRKLLRFLFVEMHVIVVLYVRRLLRFLFVEMHIIEVLSVSKLLRFLLKEGRCNDRLKCLLLQG